MTSTIDLLNAAASDLRAAHTASRGARRVIDSVLDGIDGLELFRRAELRKQALRGESFALGVDGLPVSLGAL